MKIKVTIAVLVVAAVPVCALAQKQDTAALKAYAQKIVETISSDKARNKVYCDIVKLGDQIEDAVQKSKTAGQLSLQMSALEQTLGPDYAALMDELQDIDPHSKDAAEIGLMFAALDKSCVK
jgi:hypothetical protein